MNTLHTKVCSLVQGQLRAACHLLAGSHYYESICGGKFFQLTFSVMLLQFHYRHLVICAAAQIEITLALLNEVMGKVGSCCLLKHVICIMCCEVKHTARISGITEKGQYIARLCSD